MRRRIVIAQALYAGCAAPSFFHTAISTGLILLIQINYAVASRRGRQGRRQADIAEMSLMIDLSPRLTL